MLKTWNEYYLASLPIGISWICLGDNQKSHLPPVCSHKIAINLSSDPKIALCTITGLAKPVFKFPVTLYFSSNAANSSWLSCWWWGWWCSVFYSCLTGYSAFFSVFSTLTGSSGLSFFLSRAYFFLASIYSGVSLIFYFFFLSSLTYSGCSSLTYLALYCRLNLTGSWKSNWQVPHWCCLPKVSNNLKSILGP